MEKEIRVLVDRILNEKIQLLLNRIDLFQNQMIGEVDNLKQLDNLIDYDIPGEFLQLLKKGEKKDKDELDELNKQVKKVFNASTQTNLISSFLEGIHLFCNRSALFLLRDDKLVGWRGKGFRGEGDEIGDDDIKNLFFSLSANTILKKVLETRKPFMGNPISEPDDFLIYNRFGGSRPDSILVMPFFVKGKPQAIIYCDSEEGKPIQRNPIEILATVGEMSLDLLPIRQKMITRVKTQEYIENDEPKEEKLERTTIQEIDEMERTSTSLKENDPERLARVIVNDVILYNQKLIEEGIKNKNLYDLLKDTLLQAKELYKKRAYDIKYFEAQLINTLAKGDKSALKGYKFEVFK